jgi:N-acetylglucosaminyl-diphospho-decaprenol L-rhamnosyltransferase
MSALTTVRPEAVEVAVVIVNYRTADLTKLCLAALYAEKETLPLLRVLVVDGASEDGSVEIISEVIARPDYREWASLLPLPVNGGFGWANNQGIMRLARDTTPPEFIHLLNPDTQVARGAVRTLITELQRHPRCGAVGSKLLSPDGSSSASAFRFPSAGRELLSEAQSKRLGRILGIAPTVIEAEESVEADWVSGASVMLRSDAIREAGLFDDGFFLYFEEVELMHRLRRRGWTVRHVPESRVTHIEGAITGLAAGGTARSLPPYWYQARRRYFGLTGGVGAVLAANVGWLAGRSISLAKRAFRSTRADRPVAKVSKLGFWPSDRETRPSVPRWGDAPGTPPAWMTRG